MDAMSVIFVEYATTADRDKARVETLGQNVDARELTPGVGPAVERATPSGRTNGNYVEFAYQASGKTVSGIWWDDSSTPHSRLPAGVLEGRQRGEMGTHA
nr:hypothetical protein GCM10020092_019380 [Actinoplanes digitatis]